MINTVVFQGNQLKILDQSQLPDQVVYITCKTPFEVADAIKFMKVRGAPLIGVTAAFGLAMAVNNFDGPREGLDSFFCQVKEHLASTRPTAVNLFWALARMERIYKENASLDTGEIARHLADEAEKMHSEDIKTNMAIGEHGQELLGENCRVMTICNAGALATCGYGTALGVVRSAFKKGKIAKVWACETRPVLQGARLTVWELLQDNIPVTLITDSTAGYIMELGEVDAVITGADRIAANGDTANKIGTYSLAVLAAYHSIPFYVAAPLSTVDLDTASGSEIPIEKRSQDEVRQIRGLHLTVPEVRVFNPAFDVTPHKLISGIITEKGVMREPFAETLKAVVKGR